MKARYSITLGLSVILRLKATRDGDMGEGFGVGLQFQLTDDDTANNSAGVVGAMRESASDDDTSLFFRTRSSADGTVEHMRITSEGRVGVGTQGPNAKLEVRADNPSLRVAGDDGKTASLQLYEMTGEIPYGFELQYDGSTAKDELNLWTRSFSGNEASRMTWTKSGRVGIGTNAPATRLHVNGDVQIDTMQENVSLTRIVVADTNGKLHTRPSASLGGGSTTGDGHSLDSMNGDYENVVFVNAQGRVGINTSDPGAQLEIVSTNVGLSGVSVQLGSVGATKSGVTFPYYEMLSFIPPYLFDYATASVTYDGEALSLCAHSDLGQPSDTEGITILNGGAVGIGTEPDNPLTVFGVGSSSGGDGGAANEVVARFRNTLSDQHSAISIDAPNGKDAMLYFAENGVGKWDIRRDEDGNKLQVRLQEGTANTSILTVSPDQRVGIGTTSPLAKLDVRGTTRTEILEITGGADIAEPFEVHAANAQPGMIVCIDPAHPGELTISDTAYDRKVAGIISGAGGVNPGMVMGQQGSVADGTNPVALTGRVYCNAETSNGFIQPGDLLTTSPTAGHAMKVTDYARAQGAIIGKAMTGLDKEKGLILVLVSLQ